MEAKEPIRIAHIVGKWVGGGVEAVIMNYYRNIDKSKIQFDFICDNDSTDIPYDEIEKLGGKVILVPPYQKLFKYQKELKKIFKEQNYKIVHSHINTLSVFPLRVAKKAGVPVRIAHSHSRITRAANIKEFKRNLIKNILKHFSKIYPTHFFACSRVAAESQFGGKKVRNNQIYYVDNAVKLCEFTFDENLRKKKRKMLNISENTFVIGNVGRFVPVKNHEYILKIFRYILNENQDTKLILVGSGPLLEKIKDRTKKMGIEDKVMFLGQRNDIIELYHVFDVFVLPSLYEGLPVVGIEAQATGLPCFFSNNVTEEAKMLNTTKFLSIEIEPREWAKIILSEFKGRNIEYEIINNRFNIEIEAKKLMNKYIELLEKYYLN